MGDSTALEELLADRRRVLGKEDLRTLRAWENFARWGGEAGDPVGAAAAFAELLEDTVRVLGEDHPLTRTARRTLDHWKEKDGACSPGSNGHT